MMIVEIFTDVFVKAIKRPSLHIAMPCYDSVKIATMISIAKLVKELTMAALKFEINTM